MNTTTLATLVPWLAALALTIAATGFSSLFQGMALLKKPKKYGGYLMRTGVACIAVAVAYLVLLIWLAFTVER